MHALSTPAQQRLRAQLAPHLPAGLMAHMDRVVTLAGAVARRRGLDAGRPLLAAQGHDVLRAVEPAELLARAEARGLEIDAVERAQPVLLHGPLGALALRERFDVDDERVLHAVHWHSTGHPDFDPGAWAFFVADKVEPRKVERWPALVTVRERAVESLEAAALAYLELSAERGQREGWALHPMARRTADALRAATRD